MITIVIGAIASIVPDHASASTYRWIASGGGSWTSFGNWTLEEGTIGLGYPSQAGDIAKFTASMANRTITINQIISIGRLEITDPFNVFFTGNDNGVLQFDGTGNSTTFIETNSTGSHVIGVPVSLSDHLQITVADPAGRLTFTAGIHDFSFPRSLSKFGPGTAHFYSLEFNSYSGSTTVAEGALELQHLNGRAISGPLIIGKGIGQSATAIVRLRDDDQLADGQFVQVLSDGLLEVGSNNDEIGALSINGGTVTIGNGPTGTSDLDIGDCAMIGGTLDVAQNSRLISRGDFDITSTAAEPALVSGSGSIGFDSEFPTFDVANGPQSIDMEIQPSLHGTEAFEGLSKTGAGVLRFTGGTLNEYVGLTRVLGGRLQLARVGGRSIPGNLQISEGSQFGAVDLIASDNIRDTSTIFVLAGGQLRVDGATEKIERLEIDSNALVQVGAASTAHLTTNTMAMYGSRLEVFTPSTVHLGSALSANSTATSTSTIAGNGSLVLDGPTVAFNVSNGPQAIDLQILPAITGASSLEISKGAPGTLSLDGSTEFGGRIHNTSGRLFINGTMPNLRIELGAGTLGGTGRTGSITVVDTSTIAPGLSPGILTIGSTTAYPELTLALELNGTTPGTGYDQLKVIGTITLNDTTLSLTASSAPPPGARFTIIDNDGTDPIGREFAGLAEGAAVMIAGEEFRISYVGGDGNDVVLSSTAPGSYYLAEGATGGFFDDDVLIANPTTSEAPVTMTFLLEGGGTVVEHRTIAPQSRATVHVDQIAGLEATSPSVQVTSDNAVPLIVERSMFWDATYYGGHTANAVAQPELKWVFAEGFQGFFDTYVLIANANPEPTTATIIFLRENDTPIVKTVPIEAFARKTVYAGDYPEIVGRAFGIVVEATRPVIAERAMYFGTSPGHLWAGGHANTGITAPSRSWFHAEGATGGYFSTFILLSNPQDTPAHVELRFLLDTGEVITRSKTIEAQQRLTINPAGEGDPRLTDAAVSTVVESDVPIVSERSMYWSGDGVPFGEGHNSAGVVQTATRWGLAEGRVGGPHQFATYILLANPEPTTAEVTITYLRENGAPIVKTYSVPPTSRFNVDIGSVAELKDESFGARIEVTNGVEIAVERSLYWNANGVFWAGGTNALATPLP